MLEGDPPRQGGSAPDPVEEFAGNGRLDADDALVSKLVEVFEGGMAGELI